VRSAPSNSSIEQAELSIEKAFDKVLAAEEAGGNVTALILKLNSAGELLASAQNAYQSGNIANAKDDAVTAQLIADQVASDASTLIDSSITSGRVNFLTTAIFSLVGASLFLIILFLVWRSVKRSYMRKLDRLKPEGIT